MNKVDIIVISGIIAVVGVLLFLRLEVVTEQTSDILKNQNLMINLAKSIQTVLDRQLNASDEQQSLVDQITELETEVKSLKAEIAVLKEEIATLKQELTESRIIISEQQENITATS